MNPHLFTKILFVDWADFGILSTQILESSFFVPVSILICSLPLWSDVSSSNIKESPPRDNVKNVDGKEMSQWYNFEYNETNIVEISAQAFLFWHLLSLELMTC